ncbi:hypothetical protein DPEC_G00012070 [Dallia pectoralis]|uniref:Uncharacterized protein n=1 Tax=Dallia pectoralis TaxID=75939 RepID=A0ACC2HLZ0_DALPE|nr:hypothetical protein DPEC_G00012070 [Dallia pectoralis]
MRPAYFIVPPLRAVVIELWRAPVTLPWKRVSEPSRADSHRASEAWQRAVPPHPPHPSLNPGLRTGALDAPAFPVNGEAVSSVMTSPQSTSLNTTTPACFRYTDQPYLLDLLIAALLSPTVTHVLGVSK